MTDVALAKRCRRLGVPVPGLGYWVRIGAVRAPADPDKPLGPEALTIPLFTPVTRI